MVSIEYIGSILHLICKQSVSFPKGHTLRRHFVTKHSDFNQKYSGEFRKDFGHWKSNRIFQICSESPEEGVEVGFETSHSTFKLSIPFTEGDIVKNSLLKLLLKELSDKVWSRQLEPNDSQRRTADISKDIETHLSDKFNKCVDYSLNVNESMDITSTARMCIFERGVVWFWSIWKTCDLFNARRGRMIGFHSGTTM